MSILGSIIGATGGLLGGMWQSKEAGKVASHNADITQQANAANLEFARENLQFQKDAAQNGLRWRVAEAKDTGINPLVALGANTFNPSPVYAGQQGLSQSYDGGDLGLSRVGQDIGRAVSAKMTESERLMKADLNNYTRTKWEQDLTLGELAIQKANRELQNQPPMPNPTGPAGIVSGQTGINQVPAEQVVSGRLGVEKGARPMNKIDIDKTGRVYFTLGKSSEEALENDWYNKTLYMGNRAIEALGNVGSNYWTWIRNHFDGSNNSRKVEVAKVKWFIARELGLKDTKYIGYNIHKDQYYVTEAGQRILNKGGN